MSRVKLVTEEDLRKMDRIYLEDLHEIYTTAKGQNLTTEGLIRKLMVLGLVKYPVCDNIEVSDIICDLEGNVFRVARKTSSSFTCVNLTTGAMHDVDFVYAKMKGVEYGKLLELDTLLQSAIVRLHSSDSITCPSGKIYLHSLLIEDNELFEYIANTK